MPNDLKSNLLIGEKGIMDRFGFGDKVLNVFLRMGMPVTRINGRLYAHADNVDKWLRDTTMTGDYKDVPDGKINGGDT